MSLAVCAAAPRVRHIEWFHDHTRVDDLLLDGTVAPVGGALHPDRTRPGHGLHLSDAADDHLVEDDT